MKDELWPNQFSASLAKYISREDTFIEGTDVPVESIYPPEFNDHRSPHFQILMAIFKATWARKVSRYIDLTNVALERTESPGEKCMLGGLLITAYKSIESVRVQFKGRNEFDYEYGDEESWNNLVIEVQKPIGSMHVNFFLSYRQFDDNPESLENQNHAWLKSELIVECNEIEDSKKDRALQDLGYQIYRFKPEDVWTDALSCAEEAIKFLTKPERLRRTPIAHPVPGKLILVKK